MNNKRRGFTLVELLVVVSIIGILSTLVFVNLVNSKKKANDSKRMGDINTIRTALELYREYNDNYPQVGITNTVDCWSDDGQNNVAADLAVLLKNFLSEMPSDPNPVSGVSGIGYYCGDYNYTYGAPNWWNTNSQYRMEVSLEMDMGDKINSLEKADGFFPDDAGRYGYVLAGPIK